jgi:large subunit ribosomal protein L25
MEQFVMDARRREANGTGAARANRREGLVPGVVYGQGQDPISILLDTKQLVAFLRHHGSLINLTIDGQVAAENLAALLKQTQRHPVSREVLSVDLQWVSMAEEVELGVPVVIVGSSPGVARDGGALDQSMHEVLVACLPGDIPEHIEIDVSEMEIGHSLHVRDMTAPAGVRLVTGADEAVVSVLRPISKEDLEAQLEAPELVEGEEAAEAPAEGAEAAEGAAEGEAAAAGEAEGG